MGSSGSGRISDYPGSSGSGTEGGGDAGGVDRCSKGFSARLEDVEHSDFYKKNRSAPPAGTQVQVVQGKRIIVATMSGESIGALPTSFNYLLSCILDGWLYIGAVQNANTSSVGMSITVDFIAQRSA
jgi:hypothetical protein